MERETNRMIARKTRYAVNNLDRMSNRLMRDIDEYIGCLQEVYPMEEVGSGIMLLAWARDVAKHNKELFYGTLQDTNMQMIRNREPSSSWKTIFRDGEEEYICEHGIGHWHWPHSCDGCCRHDNYPGKGKKVEEDE